MHDCPGCRVPLHGYEEVCPSCGTRQVVRRGSNQFSNFKPEKPSINLIPFVLVFLVLGVVGIFAASSSWIGKLATEGPPKEDPMAKMTYLEARGIIQNELNTGLSSLGATAKLTWQDAADSSPTDMNADKNVTLTVDTALADPNARKPIIDKVKDYMEKAKVMTLTMNDSKNRAHWTYNMVAPVGGGPSEE
jgi:hypothetical protein